jgi:hypothetical protein
MRYVAAGAAVILAIFMAMVWMQDQPPSSTDDIPVVKAPTEPYKTPPGPDDTP